MAIGTNYYIRVLLSAFVYPADMPRQWCAHLWGCLWGIGGCYPSRTPSLVLAPGWWPGGLIPYLKGCWIPLPGRPAGRVPWGAFSIHRSTQILGRKLPARRKGGMASNRFASGVTPPIPGGCGVPSPFHSFALAALTGGLFLQPSWLAPLLLHHLRSSRPMAASLCSPLLGALPLSHLADPPTHSAYPPVSCPRGRPPTRGPRGAPHGRCQPARGAWASEGAGGAQGRGGGRELLGEVAHRRHCGLVAGSGRGR